MSIKLETSNTDRPTSRAGLAWIMSGFGPKIMLAPENEGGTGENNNEPENKDELNNEDKNKSENREVTLDDKDKNKKPTDEEARLLKEVMDKKAKLKSTEDALKAAQDRLKDFDGLDAAELRKLLAERKDAEAKALEAKGEWDRLKAMMAEEHNKVLTDRDTKINDLASKLERSQSVINDLTVGAAFSNSSFVTEELVLTPSKARTVYGAHFEVEDGKVVAYDKPRNSANRTMLVNGSGDPLSFEDAIKKLVEIDPDRDSLIRSKLNNGAGSKTVEAKKTDTQQTSGLKGRARIAANLGKAIS